MKVTILLIPPYATLSVLWDRQAKGSEPTKEELLRKYESDYAGTADRMVSELLTFAGKTGAGNCLDVSPVSRQSQPRRG